MQRLIDRAAVIDTIVAFANAFDRQDWPRLRSLLTDELDTDYSEFRGEPPARVSANDYVRARETGLAGVRTLHLSTNHEVTISGDEATCYSAYQIFRVSQKDVADRLDTAGNYEHRLQRHADGWRICAVRQTVVVLSGKPAVHGALR